MHKYPDVHSEAYGLKKRTGISSPKGQSTAHLRILVPKTVPGRCFGTIVLKWAVYGRTLAVLVWQCVPNSRGAGDLLKGPG